MRLRGGSLVRGYTLRVVVDVLTSVNVHCFTPARQPLLTRAVVHVHVRVTEVVDQEHVTGLALVTACVAGSFGRSEKEAAHTPIFCYTTFCVSAVGRGCARLSQEMDWL